MINAAKYMMDIVHKQIAELLIAKGANVNHADKRGKTALDYAQQREFEQITSLLEGGKKAITTDADATDTASSTSAASEPSTL